MRFRRKGLVMPMMNERGVPPSMPMLRKFACIVM